MNFKSTLALAALVTGCGGSVEAQNSGVPVEADAGMDSTALEAASDVIHDDVIDVMDAKTDAGDEIFLKEMFVSPRVINHDKKQDFVVRAIFNEMPEETTFGLYDESFKEIQTFSTISCLDSCDDPNRLDHSVNGSWAFIPGYGNYFIKYTGKVGGQIVEEQFYSVSDEAGAETYCPEDEVICLNQIDVFAHPFYTEDSKNAECMSFYVINKTGEEVRFSLAGVGIYLSSQGQQIAVDQNGQPWVTNVRFSVSDVDSEVHLFDIPLIDSEILEQPGDAYYVLDSANEIYFPADAKPKLYSLLLDLRQGTGTVAPWCIVRADADQIVTGSQTSFDIDKFQVTPGDNYEGHKTHLTSINLPY